MSDTVAINRTHLEALIRRAEFFSTDTAYDKPYQLQTVTISRVEYEGLCESEKEYGILKKALIGGGISQEALSTLIHGNSEHPRKDSAFVQHSWAESADECTSGLDSNAPIDDYDGPFMPRRLASMDTTSYRGNLRYAGHKNNQDVFLAPGKELTWQQQNDFLHKASPTSLDYDGGLASAKNNNRIQDEPFPNHGKRTIVITGLSERTTYKDLTDVIRGGRILYITIRNDRTAAVFMLEGAAAFIAHVKRHDLYVQTKRLEVHWNDHQFSLSSYVGRKIAAGASRNLVLRNAARIVDIAEMRHHMEHIHKFYIIDVVTRGKDVFVYTNSVHNALFARTCMLSRKPYKGLRIEFFPDECAAPLPATKPHPAASRTPSGASVIQTPDNLFELLSLDSDEENRPPGREDDDDNTIDDDGSDYGVRLD